MGGSVAVTVRRVNGEVIRMCRWTNPLPLFVQDVRWIDGDESHLDKYLKTWNELRDDWEKYGGDSQKIPEYSDPSYGSWMDKFDLNMTPVYAPYPFLAPQGYGLVMFDYQNKTVLTMQGYSALIELFPLHFLEEGTEDHARYRGLLERGCVYAASHPTRDPNNPGNVRHVRDMASVQTILGRNPSDSLLTGPWFFMDPSPWTIERFPETPEGTREMRDRVLNLGLHLSDHEEGLWEEFEKQWEDA